MRPVGGTGDAEATKWSRPGRLRAGATPRGRGVAAGPGRRGQLFFLSSRKKTLLHHPRCSRVLVSDPGRAEVGKEPFCVKASLHPPVRGLGAMDSSALERDAVQFARLAVQRDHEGRYCEAVFYYKVNPELRLPSTRPRGEVHVPNGQTHLALLLNLFLLLLLSFAGKRRPGCRGQVHPHAHPGFFLQEEVWS